MRVFDTKNVGVIELLKLRGHIFCIYESVLNDRSAEKVEDHQNISSRLKSYLKTITFKILMAD